MKIADCVTEQTKALYENLCNNNFHIELSINPKLLGKSTENWGMIPVYKIVAPNTKVNQEAFAHELLHIQLFSLGFMDSNTICYLVDKERLYFSDEFVTKINNNLAHFKMLPTFIRMGFNKKYFLHGDISEQLKQSKERIEKISTNLNNNARLQSILCEYSIIKFFEHFYELETEECFHKLKQLDQSLFSIIELTFSDWIQTSDSDNTKFFQNLLKGIKELNIQKN